ncbi:MAG: hypothetical protein IRY83_10445 [Chloroflexi bacterium]|nr:hypothetical protein [Chloroflexota bacterium]
MTISVPFLSALSPLALASGAVIIALVLLSVVVWLERDGGWACRSVPARAALADLAARSDGAVHLSPGTASLGRSDTLAILAGLLGLRTSADPAVPAHEPARLTTGDALTYFLARSVVDARAELIALDPAAYIAAVTDLLRRETPAANIMLGPLDDTYLMPIMAARSRGTVQITGSTRLPGMPIAPLASDRGAIGEESVVIGFLAGGDTSMARAMDLARLVVITVTAAMVAARFVGAG